MKEAFETEPVYLMPILGSILFGALCAYLVLTSNVGLYAVAPFPEGVGSLGNGLYFVVLAGVGAALMYYLVRRQKHGWISIIIGLAITVAVLMLSIVYLSAVCSLFNVPFMVALILTTIASVCVTAFMDFAIFRGRGRVCNLAILLLGGGFGAFLGVSIPTLSAILILAFLAVYDIFAVYRGHVGKIAQGGLEKLRGISFAFRDVQMGLGDLTFYSMLTSLVLADAGPIFFIASVVGVLIGAFFALKMLEKRGIFPGLPFPIALGLVPLIVFLFL